MTDVNGRFDDLMRTEFPAGIEPADTELPLIEPDPEWFNEPPEDDFAPPPVIAGNPWSMLGKAGAALVCVGLAALFSVIFGVVLPAWLTGLCVAAVAGGAVLLLVRLGQRPAPDDDGIRL